MVRKNIIISERTTGKDLDLSALDQSKCEIVSATENEKMLLKEFSLKIKGLD